MKQKIMHAAVSLLVALAATNCEKKDDNDDAQLLGSLLLLTVADQLSGNCASVQKAGDAYTAQLNGIPKGGCNFAALVGDTREAALANMQSTFSRAIEVANSAVGCTAISAALTAQLNAMNVDMFGATEEFYQQQVVPNRAVYPIGSALAEGQASLVTTMTAATFTAEQIGATRIASVPDEATAVLVISAALGGGDAACAAGIAAAYPFVASTVGVAGVLAGTTVAGVTSPVIASLTCNYGTGATAQNQCATLNTRF